MRSRRRRGRAPRSFRRSFLADDLSLPIDFSQYRPQPGQYEFLAEMEARLRYVIPLTLVLVVVLLYLSMIVASPS